MNPDSRPTLLIVTQSIPSETGMGVAMRLGNWLESACVSHQVTLLVVSADATCQPSGLSARWAGMCNAVHFLNVASQASVMPHGRLHRRLLRRSPALWDRWPMPAIRQGLEGVLPRHTDAQSFDAVLVFRLRLWPVWTVLKKLGWSARRVVLDLDDVESEAAKRHIRTLGSGHYGRLGVWLERLEVHRLRRAQRQVLHHADAVCLASPEDHHLLEPLEPVLRGRLHTIPNAVRLPQALTPRTPPLADFRPLNLLFLGALNYMPNEQAVNWWLTRVEPLLRKRMGDRAPRLRVVGRFPPQWMRARQDLDLHADVPSVQPYFEDCDALVVPLLTGGGTRIKILEAMAYGRPVVSTSVGAEGLSARPGVDFLLADTPEAFVDAVCNLDAQSDMGRALVGNAMTLVHERFSLDVVAQSMRKLLLQSSTV